MPLNARYAQVIPASALLPMSSSHNTAITLAAHIHISARFIAISLVSDKGNIAFSAVYAMC
jgi:hypothetical protein